MSKAKVLVVEDEGIVAKDIQSTLIQFGYDVPEVVSSGEEAIQATYRHDPDLVLMDIMIKGDLDGIDAAEIIHNQFNIPVVFLTAYSDEETLRRAKMTESYGFVSKPYEDKELFIATEFALYKHSMLKKMFETKVWLDAILRSLSEGVIATDKNGYISFMNPAAEQLFDVKEYEVKSKDLKELLVFEGGHTAYKEGPQKIILKNNSQKWVELKVSPIREEKGNLIGKVIVVKEAKGAGQN
jgi:PAS domain S-box-containing protein